MTMHFQTRSPNSNTLGFAINPASISINTSAEALADMQQRNWILRPATEGFIFYRDFVISGSLIRINGSGRQVYTKQNFLDWCQENNCEISTTTMRDQDYPVLTRWLTEEIGLSEQQCLCLRKGYLQDLGAPFKPVIAEVLSKRVANSSNQPRNGMQSVLIQDNNYQAELDISLDGDSALIFESKMYDIRPINLENMDSISIPGTIITRGRIAKNARNQNEYDPTVQRVETSNTLLRDLCFDKNVPKTLAELDQCTNEDISSKEWTAIDYHAVLNSIFIGNFPISDVALERVLNYDRKLRLSSDPEIKASAFNTDKLQEIYRHNQSKLWLRVYYQDNYSKIEGIEIDRIEPTSANLFGIRLLEQAGLTGKNWLQQKEDNLKYALDNYSSQMLRRILGEPADYSAMQYIKSSKLYQQVVKANEQELAQLYAQPAVQNLLSLPAVATELAKDNFEVARLLLKDNSKRQALGNKFFEPLYQTHNNRQEFIDLVVKNKVYKGWTNPSETAFKTAHVESRFLRADRPKPITLQQPEITKRSVQTDPAFALAELKRLIAEWKNVASEDGKKALVNNIVDLACADRSGKVAEEILSGGFWKSFMGMRKHISDAINTSLIFKIINSHAHNEKVMAIITKPRTFGKNYAKRLLNLIYNTMLHGDQVQRLSTDLKLNPFLATQFLERVTDLPQRDDVLKSYYSEQANSLCQQVRAHQTTPQPVTAELLFAMISVYEYRTKTGKSQYPYQYSDGDSMVTVNIPDVQLAEIRNTINMYFEFSPDSKFKIDSLMQNPQAMRFLSEHNLLPVRAVAKVVGAVAEERETPTEMPIKLGEGYAESMARHETGLAEAEQLQMRAKREAPVAHGDEVAPVVPEEEPADGAAEAGAEEFVGGAAAEVGLAGAEEIVEEAKRGLAPDQLWTPKEIAEKLRSEPPVSTDEERARLKEQRKTLLVQEENNARSRWELVSEDAVEVDPPVLSASFRQQFPLSATQQAELAKYWSEHLEAIPEHVIPGSAFEAAKKQAEIERAWMAAAPKPYDEHFERERLKTRIDSIELTEQNLSRMFDKDILAAADGQDYDYRLPDDLLKQYKYLTRQIIHDMGDLVYSVFTEDTINDATLEKFKSLRNLLAVRKEILYQHFLIQVRNIASTTANWPPNGVTQENLSRMLVDSYLGIRTVIHSNPQNNFLMPELIGKPGLEAFDIIQSRFIAQFNSSIDEQKDNIELKKMLSHFKEGVQEGMPEPRKQLIILANQRGQNIPALVEPDSRTGRIEKADKQANAAKIAEAARVVFQTNPDGTPFIPDIDGVAAEIVPLLQARTVVAAAVEVGPAAVADAAAGLTAEQKELNRLAWAQSSKVDSVKHLPAETMRAVLVTPAGSESDSEREDEITHEDLRTKLINAIQSEESLIKILTRLEKPCNDPGLGQRVVNELELDVMQQIFCYAKNYDEICLLIRSLAITDYMIARKDELVQLAIDDFITGIESSSEYTSARNEINKILKLIQRPEPRELLKLYFEKKILPAEPQSPDTSPLTGHNSGVMPQRAN